jgi:dTDP-4-dehydrorhamnose 3,5-epimerase
MSHLQESPFIKGLYIVQLKVFEDSRGRFMETFRKEWFPQREWGIIQNNRSDSKKGVLRGLHFHYHQVDYWYCPFGRIRAGLVDLRPESPTFRNSTTVEMGEENNVGLFVPVGVAHGFAALTDCTLMYVVDNYYDSTDEFGVIWNDAEIGIDWGLENPIISDRDAQNPPLSEVLAARVSG